MCPDSLDVKLDTSSPWFTVGRDDRLPQAAMHAIATAIIHIIGGVDGEDSLRKDARRKENEK
jgi:hypothetical protein